MATIHHHSSDERFCGSSDHGRQFTLSDDAVTCCACARSGPAPRIVAMVNSQGTACAETMLVNGEDTPKQRAAMEAFYCKGSDDCPIAGSWCDCSDNDALIELWFEAEAA